MTYGERLEIENIRIKEYIENKWKSVRLDRLASHELYSLYIKCENERDTESCINTLDMIIELWKDIRRDIREIERMDEVLDCNHKFEDTGYSRVFENNMIHMQRCENCDITIQRKSDDEFSLGFWKDEK